MSPVLYRFPPESTGGSTVSLHPVEVNGRKLYWLDEMLEGGIELPSDLCEQNHRGPAFLLLLAGPPGTGKTIFALELCYNLARFSQASLGVCLRSLYISTETTGQRIIENAMSFGWRSEYFNDWKKTRTLQLDTCNVFGAEQFRSLEVASNPSALFTQITECYSQWAPSPRLCPHMSGEHLEKMPPDVVVLDSLNVLWPQAPSAHNIRVTVNTGDAPPILAEAASQRDLLETFYKVREGISGGRESQPPRLIIVILDSFFGQQPGNPWEFLGDAAMRFDSDVGVETYFSRSFQIVKIKTQTHALGHNHVYKIIGGGSGVHDPIHVGEEAITASTRCEEQADKEVETEEVASSPSKHKTTGMPLLESGGTFVFPSIHWHLSRSIREDPLPSFSRSERYPTGLPALDVILGSGTTTGQPGFPSMHTTALVGNRGGMKSHLAYHFMLSHAMGTGAVGNTPKNVLLVSLQDDLESAKNTLIRLIEQQDIGGSKARAFDALNDLMKTDRVEIVYNWPGCVTPNELFHRIFVALARNRGAPAVKTTLSSSSKTAHDMKYSQSSEGRLTAEVVVVTGLDHLEVKFPLCAKEKVFVPALVSLFRCFKVCSVIVSAGVRDGSAFDVRPLSDLILEFSDAKDEDVRRAGAEQTIWQSSKVVATRVPAGQIGGLWGVLSRRADGAMEFSSAAPTANTKAVSSASPK